MKNNTKGFKNTKMLANGKLPDEYFINVFEENNPETADEVVEILAVFNAQLLAKAEDKEFEEKNRYPQKMRKGAPSFVA